MLHKTVVNMGQHTAAIHGLHEFTLFSKPCGYTILLSLNSLLRDNHLSWIKFLPNYNLWQNVVS